jgi:hypothetical protein
MLVSIFYQALYFDMWWVVTHDLTSSGNGWHPDIETMQHTHPTKNMFRVLLLPLIAVSFMYQYYVSVVKLFSK